MDTELFTILNFVLENNSYIRSVMPFQTIGGQN